MGACMGKAKNRTRAPALAFAAFLAGFAIASCGGRIDPGTTGANEDGTIDYDGDAPASSAGDSGSSSSSPFDAGSISPFGDGGSEPYPPVDHGPQDTSPACESRPALDCACAGEDCPKPPDSYLAQIVNDCLESGGYVCNWVYVDYDSDGCAIDLRALEPNDVFVACVTKELDSQRWKCMSSGGTLSTYVDCTTK